MGKRRTVAVVVAAVVVVTAGGGAFAYRSIKAQAATAASCASITAQITERGSTVTVPGDGGKVAILGDSYASGDGLAQYRDAWPYVFADETERAVAINGIGKTGFVNGGYCGGQQFSTRLSEVLSVDPDVLVIQGGINDAELSPEDVSKAVDALLVDVPASVSVLLVGPLDVPNRDDEAQIDAVLQEAAARQSVEYASALHWNVSLQADAVHPDQEGAREFAANVFAALNASL